MIAVGTLTIIDVVSPRLANSRPKVLRDMEKLKQIWILDDFVYSFQTHVMHFLSCLENFYLSFVRNLNCSLLTPVSLLNALVPLEGWIIVIVEAAVLNSLNVVWSRLYNQSFEFRGYNTTLIVQFLQDIVTAVDRSTNSNNDD